MMKKLSAAFASLLLCAGSATAAEAFTWGGDLRVRVTDLGDVPHNAGGHFDQVFNRNRTRVWLQYQTDEHTLWRARFTNEFRFYDRGRQYTKNWDPLNEIIVDELYADFKNLGSGNLALRVGRQELIYGTGKVILEGTPSDGSRTLFFNALKASLQMGANDIDFLAVYNTDKDYAAINRESKLRMIEHDEAGIGFYGKHRQLANMPFESYWIYKVEYDSRTALRTFEDAKFHTVGGRFMPDFGNGVKANIELALQHGDHGDIRLRGQMLDAELSYRPAMGGTLKPAFVAGYYYLSGNDAGSEGRNEGWHPVFSRWPQISELYVYSLVGTQYGVAGWSNLDSFSIGMDLVPFSDGSLKLRYHKLYANEKDGSGTGKDRGDLITAVLGFKLSPSLTGHVWGEWLQVGDYYAKGTDDGQFLRANIVYSF